MSTFTFLHAADIHLDSPLRGLSQFGETNAETLRTATRVALRNLVDLAIEESVAFVLIAGDVYDGDWDDVRTGLFMAQQMGRLRDRGIPVFIIHGNHDAVTKMSFNVPFPDNVAVFGHKKPETRRLDGIDVAIHGQSFATQAVTDNLARAYPNAIPNAFNIGMLHTSLDGREGHASYAPCSVEDLKAKQYDYWALGHVHTREVVSEMPWIVYPGNPQGRSIRETGERGAMLVTVDASGGSGPEVSAKFRPLDAARWLSVEIDVSSADAPERLHDLFRERLSQVRQENDRKLLVIRLVVTGRSVWSDTWIGDQKRWNFELRAIADQTDELMIEKIMFRTKSSAEPGRPDDDDDPIAAIEQSVDEYRSTPTLLKALVDGLKTDLGNKLPGELSQGAEPLSMDEAFVASILEEVGPLLRIRLTAHDSTE